MFDRNLKFRMALLIGLVAIGLAALPVVAQEADEVASDEMIEQAMERSFEGEVTVTGSLIPRSDLTALSPVAVLDAPTELTYSGIVRIEDLIVQMPQAFAGQNSTVSNGATGAATIDLRQMGSVRTLVLMNGRRLPAGDVYSVAPDINTIPAALVKRVDVLTGGASTVYGSDAMVGVVNFVLDTDFEGVRGGFQASSFQHNNNDTFIQNLVSEQHSPGWPNVAPTGSTWDGENYNFNVALGGKFADGKGHASAYVDYRKIAAVRKANRDFLYCAPVRGDEHPVCGGSGTTPWGTFYDNEFNVWVLPWEEEGYDGHTFIPGDGRVFNYAPDNFVQRPDEKWNAGAFANYEINKHFDVYIETTYMANGTDAQIAYSGNFFSTEAINCDNPMMSEQQRQVICFDQGYGPTDQAYLGVLRRNVEGEPRNSNLTRTSSRIVAGMRGEITDNWDYDFYYLRGLMSQNQSYQNDLHVPRLQRALDIIEDPTTGEWVCRNNADGDVTNDDGCVPWNVFQQGGITQDAIDYVTTAALIFGTTEIEVFNLTFTSDWENYGIAIPSASEGVQVALGAEYREEHFDRVTDDVYSNGWTSGGGGAQNDVQGAINVKEAFLEVLIPIVQDVKGIQDLSLELGYRYSDWSTSGGVSTYKAQLSYAPTQSWRLRGGYNRAIRAANILELFLPQGYNLNGSRDPCANAPGEVPTATLAQCLLTGMTEAQYGNVPENPAGQYNNLQGGNPDLTPETADTYTAGIVWTPQSIRGLSVTLDYYNIDIEDTIGSLSYEQILDTCLESGELCDLVNRDDRGTLWIPNGGYIATTNQNIGRRQAEGVDLSFNYLIGLGNAGYLSTDLNGSYLLRNNFSNPLVDYDCAGYFGYVCGDERSTWRHRFRATWETNFRLNISLAWRYLGEVEQDIFSDDDDLAGSEADREYEAINWMDKFPAYNWFDLAASYTLRSGLKFTVGVNNITDEDPPFGPNWADNPNYTMHGSYEPLGRYIFGSVQFNF